MHSRLSMYRGETVLDDGLAAIAVPIMVHGEPDASISLLWPRAFQEPAEFAKRFLAPLQETADRISEDLTVLIPATSAT